MPIKASYASLALGISITQEGLDQVIDWGYCDAPLIGPDKETQFGTIHINFDSQAQAAVKEFVTVQRQAIEDGKAKKVRNLVVEVEPTPQESEVQDGEKPTSSAA